MSPAEIINFRYRMFHRPGFDCFIDLFLSREFYTVHVGGIFPRQSHGLAAHGVAQRLEGLIIGADGNEAVLCSHDAVGADPAEPVTPACLNITRQTVPGNTLDRGHG